MLKGASQRWFLGFWCKQHEGDGVTGIRTGFQVEAGGRTRFCLGHVKSQLLKGDLWTVDEHLGVVSVDGV